MVAESRISDLETEITKCIEEQRLIEAKLMEASREPGIPSYLMAFLLLLCPSVNTAILIWLTSGRNEIIAEFKALVSSFPEKMGNMQNQLVQHKETASYIQCLRADVQSLTYILDGKVGFVIHAVIFLKLFVTLVKTIP